MFIDCDHEECVTDPVLDYNLASSSMYRTDQSQTPSHEWYKPDEIEFEKLDPQSREHVASGGLLLRKIQSS
jgi:hypothetical protein